MKVGIIWTRLLDPQTHEFLIGGVQTYVLNLCRLCKELGWEPVAYQCSDRDFTATFEGIRVVGVNVRRVRSKRRRSVLYDAALQKIDLRQDIIVFGGDLWSVPCQCPRAISIQHGIFWDLPLDYLQVLPTRFTKFFENRFLNSGWGACVKRTIVARRAVRMFENCHNRVCVDYNFLNWYRTVSTRKDVGNTWVIPNAVSFAMPEISDRPVRQDGTIRILFARRFTLYRGTRLITKVANNILARYPNVTFTFAGEGPEKTYLRETFAKQTRVRFIKYLPDESLQIHLDHDIAVVPSVGSEGTCLSLAEAMAAGCAPVVSNVGGMTNMILDGFNGFLVMPNSEALTDAIERVITDHGLRRKIGLKAAETAREVFSQERWKSQWRDVLEYLIEQ